LACRPLNNQFGIVGVQVAREDIYLNILVNDTGGLSHYFHIDHAEIPLTAKLPRQVTIFFIRFIHIRPFCFIKYQLCILLQFLLQKPSLANGK